VAGTGDRRYARSCSRRSAPGEPLLPRTARRILSPITATRCTLCSSFTAAPCRRRHSGEPSAQTRPRIRRAARVRCLPAGAGFI
jgi:hypothetical protein